MVQDAFPCMFEKILLNKIFEPKVAKFSKVIEFSQVVEFPKVTKLQKNSEAIELELKLIEKVDFAKPKISTIHDMAKNKVAKVHHQPRMLL